MISSIIKKEFASINSTMNIVWTRCDDAKFTKFIERACSPCALVDFDNTYFGIYEPSLVICNNRLIYLDKCMSVCKFFHCPLIIIDHDPKPNMVSNNIDNSFTVKPVIQIALSKDIHMSWNRVHNYVLDYNDKSESIWKNLMYNLYKQKFLVVDKVIKNHENKK